MQSLTATQKYALLTKHKVPSKLMCFLHSILVVVIVHLGMHGLKKTLLVSMLMACFAFSVLSFARIHPKDTLQVSLWNMKSEKTKEHVSSAYHKNCMQLVDNFKHTIEHPDTTITAWYDVVQLPKLSITNQF